MSIVMGKILHLNGRCLRGFVFAASDYGGFISDGKDSFWIPVDHDKVSPDEISLGELRALIPRDELPRPTMKSIPLADCVSLGIRKCIEEVNQTATRTCR
jgi:hypothetical protein